jgi:hypothetical protein
MTNRKTFIQNYVLSLKERTRNEKSGMQIGFDWIIYNIALSKNWLPVNLPFFRSINEKDFITKTGPQFGIDMAFLNESELVIFILKDEKLNNTNWITCNFDKDIRMACTPDLTTFNKDKVKSVNIILAYNKDDDDTGIKLFNNLIQTFPSVIYNTVLIKFERWNLTKIVEEVDDSLISPDLLPQHLSGLLNYICSQTKDFNYGSYEWEKILIPSWKNFLDTLLSATIDDKRLRLIPVSLFIIDNYRNKDNPDSYAGWIDLIEWAMLAVWAKVDSIKETSLKQIIVADLWHSFYLTELEKYLLINQKLFYTEHGISSKSGVGNLSSLNDAYLAYWIIARIGIVHIGFQEIIPPEERSSNELVHHLALRSFEWIKSLLTNNPSAYRPLIDLNHIELYLIWTIIFQVQNLNFMKEWLSELGQRLMVRRHGHHKIPFIEGRNRYDLIAEYAATFSTLKEKPDDFVDTSSYLLLMLMELIFSLEAPERDELLEKYYKNIVLGIGDDNKPLSDPNYQIDLYSWEPPDDWSSKIHGGKVLEGIAISTLNFQEQRDEKLSSRVKSFIEESVSRFSTKIILDKPLASYILACIKNRSPLPPIFWRGSIFPDLFKDKNTINI